MMLAETSENVIQINILITSLQLVLVYYVVFLLCRLYCFGFLGMGVDFFVLLLLLVLFISVIIFWVVCFCSFPHVIIMYLTILSFIKSLIQTLSRKKHLQILICKVKIEIELQIKKNNEVRLSANLYDLIYDFPIDISKKMTQVYIYYVQCVLSNLIHIVHSIQNTNLTHRSVKFNAIDFYL
jgi:hypothetical protein